MSSQEELVKLMEQETSGLVDYLKTLRADAWNTQSACDLWTVADVVGHLVYVMEMVTGGVSRGIKGDITPPEGWPPAGGLDKATRNQFLANGGIERKERLGDQLLPTYERLVHQGIELAETLGPEDWDKPCYRPAGIQPARTFFPTVITETAMHSWDMRSRLEASTHLSPNSLPVFVERIPWLSQFKLGPKLASSLRYRFEVSDPVPFQGDIVNEGDKVQNEPVGTGSPDVTFRCDTETFVLLIQGRLSFETSVANGRLVADGKNDLVAEFERLLSP